MRRRFTRSLLAVTLVAAASSPTAARAAGESQVAQSPVADQGSNYRYRSVITSISPQTKGLSVQVLQFADRLLLVNHSERTVTIFGYENEPYARVLANGTTELNTRSPAYYLNKTFYGDINVPPQANAKAPPSWQVLDRTGQLEWHDHRIHYTSPALPPEVKDKGKRTLIFAWKIPLQVGGQAGSVQGQLFWVPENSSVSVAVIVIGVVIVLAGLVLVAVVRRRRRHGPPAASTQGEAAGDEAW